MFSEDFNLQDFYQSKYDYYKQFTYYVIICAALASITYFVSDCQLFGRFARETLIPRTIILLPLALFLYIQPKVKHYKIMVPVCYAIVHLIMWNTIWAIVYLPDKTHASEGFIIMHLMFFAVGFCAPFRYALVAHTLVIANILISNLFNHYQNLDIMMSLGIPCVAGICAAHYFMEKAYLDHYETARKLEFISGYDALTGIYNRNLMNDIVQEGKMQFTEEIGRSCAILMFDIDHFKQVNDTYGHNKGDIVLKSVVNAASSVLEPSDYLIRWGGEEFVIILPKCSEEEIAVNVAERLRQLVERTDNGICPVTVSVGIAFYHGESYQVVVDRADKALYMAKESGRNQVHVYH